MCVVDQIEPIIQAGEGKEGGIIGCTDEDDPLEFLGEGKSMDLFCNIMIRPVRVRVCVRQEGGMNYSR